MAQSSREEPKTSDGKTTTFVAFPSSRPDEARRGGDDRAHNAVILHLYANHRSLFRTANIFGVLLLPPLPPPRASIAVWGKGENPAFFVFWRPELVAQTDVTITTQRLATVLLQTLSY